MLLVHYLQLLKSFTKISNFLDLTLLIHGEPQTFSSLLKFLSMGSSLFVQFLQEGICQKLLVA